uniref:Uncharacterized protein n=1 Tax=Leersia perrieri TaxID=77586 RepID=A0A0D9WG26_9ORYZ
MAVSSIPRTVAHARYDYELHPEVDSAIFVDEPHVGIGNHHTDCLYIMDMSPTKAYCFEVLAYNPASKWRWRSLPRPPFFDDPEYKPPLDIPFAVVNGTKICVSTATATYAFDTVTLKWAKAGDWVLPFKVEYIPEIGICLGLSNRSPYELCTLDLSAVVKKKAPSDITPMATARHVWQDLETPENWLLLDHFLVNLGSGRLCSAKIFDITNEQDECDFNPVAVFTGVEVLPCHVRGLRMANSNKMKNGINTPEVIGSIGCLPKPSVHYQPFNPSSSKSNPHSSMDIFALLGKNKILCSDSMGYTSVYNTKLHSFLGMPMLNSLKASNPYDLCAMNLSNAVDVLPTVQHTRLDVDPPKDWLLKNCTLVNLGSGKFCVAKFFDCIDDKVVVFTGVEMVPSGEGEVGIRAVKHKSEYVVTDSI